MDTQNELTHLDLFSGIGGFAIAARSCGFRTLAFCEKDARCRRFLEKTWGIPVHPDITDLDASRYHGVSLLTGGPPCQPASRAGDQGGSSDDRWLWPQALRVLAQAQPDAVVFENPPGILDVGIDGILSEMGRLGYETQCFDIPACAVDSPQLRHRIWIVGFRVGDTSVGGLGTDRSASRGSRHTDQPNEMLADSAEPRFQGTDTECRQNGRHAQRPQSVLANAECERRSGPREQSLRSGSQARSGRTPDHDFNGDPERRDAQCAQSVLANAEVIGSGTGLCQARPEQNRNINPDGNSHWQNSIWIPCADHKLRRAPDDSFGLVDGLHRSLLGALGNAVVPQVAAQILNAVRQSL